jgi:exonuclease III
MNSGQKLARLKMRVNEWDDAFLKYLKNLDAKKPVVWTGDLNVAHHEIDIAEPKSNVSTTLLFITPNKQRALDFFNIAKYIDDQIVIALPCLGT